MYVYKLSFHIYNYFKVKDSVAFITCGNGADKFLQHVFQLCEFTISRFYSYPVPVI